MAFFLQALENRYDLQGTVDKAPGMDWRFARSGFLRSGK
jgi:hypothetical protein